MRLVGVSAKAQSGKDTFADIATTVYGNINRLAFAGCVKKEVAEFLEDCEVLFEHRHLWGDNSDKEAILRISQRYKDYEPMPGYLLEHGSYNAGWWYFTPRTLMQYFGTEYRRAQDDQYWVKKCMNSCSKSMLNIITDVRFPNEVKAIKDAGGVVVRIDRPDRPGVSNQEHPSETALDGYLDWDYIIYNHGSLADYEQSVRDVLARIVT